MKFESYVQKAARAAQEAVLAHRYLMGREGCACAGAVRNGEEMARIVGKAVRDAFK